MTNKLVIYQIKDDKIKIETHLEDETVVIHRANISFSACKVVIEKHQISSMGND